MKTCLLATLLVLTQFVTGFSQHRYNKALSRWEILACPKCTTYLPLFPLTTVNGKVGVVQLTAADINDLSNRRWMLDGERFKLSAMPNSFGPGFSIVNGELRYIGAAGSGTGDMLKSAYDQNNDGLIDNTYNAANLGGRPSSSYVLAEGGKGLSTLDFTAIYRDAITTLQTQVASLRQDLTNLQNTVSTMGQNNVNTVFSALRQLPLFGPNTVLGADANSSFTFVPISGVSSTTTSPGSTTTTTPPSSGTSAIAYGDSTVSRINEAAMSDVVINDLTTLRNYLASDISDKRLLVSRSTAEVWEGYNEQTGAWTNVKLLCINRNIELRNSTGSTAWIFQGGKARNRVCIEGFKFSSLATGGGYPVFWWNELPQINGLEVKRCEFTAPNGEFNTMGCVQYSVSSGSGNIAKNVYIHHNNLHDVGRMGMEWLSQGYDQPRLFNVVLTYNTFSSIGMNNEYGMAFSFSGLIRQLYLGNNRATNTRKVMYELVNTQDVLAENNGGVSTWSKGSVGWGISDDDKHTTRNIMIRGGDFDVTERPFYVYGSSYVTMQGQNKLWKGHRGVQMNGSNCSFDGMNILIHSTEVESSWEVTAGQNNVFRNSTISSAGATAAGYKAAFESMVLRSGTTNNTLDNITTIVGLQANGQPYASTENGGDGRIVNQGSGNTVTNNIKSTAP
jgi:hypothetical protein